VSYNPPEISAEAQQGAEKFFQHARTVAESRNYDYAIELYLQGLDKDPRAVEKGHQPLREVSLRRKMSGGKKPGFLETFKRTSASKKDPHDGMLAAEYMLAKDPLNVKYAQELVKCADRAELPETLRWALAAYFELCQGEKKLSIARLLEIKNYYEKLGGYYDKNDKPDVALECYQLGLDVLDYAIQSGRTEKYDLVSEQRDLAGRLTILRGKYERADNFRESIPDMAAQKELHDRERGVKSEELLTQMIEKARNELQANPNVTGKINSLVDLLLQRGHGEDEAEAIEILKNAEERSGQYSYEMRADDVRIRQRKRKTSHLKGQLRAQKPPDDALKQQLQEAEAELVDFELKVYQKRVEQYPTDRRLKFEYGKRLYSAKRYDDALPLFQEAVADPKSAVKAKCYIGTCFFQKGWHSQAVDVLTEAVKSYEITGDQTSKEMHYVLGRAYEELGDRDSALKTYSKLIQWEYNYRDVRQRIDKLQAKEG